MLGARVVGVLADMLGARVVWACSALGSLACIVAVGSQGSGGVSCGAHMAIDPMCTPRRLESCDGLMV